MGLFLVIGSVILYRSYAYYEEKAEYNVLKGQVGDFSYDVKLAIIVDGERKESMPTTAEANNGNYYKAEVDCGNGETIGEWDYNSWSLKLDYVETNSKCNVTFISNMSKADYEDYIQAGVALRRNTYRGKDITNLFASGELYTQISNGTFKDIYVGDYIIDNNGIKWLIADLDNYLYVGTTPLKKHHAVIIPAKLLLDAQMNETNTTEGGYVGSKMVTETLETVLNTYIDVEGAFKGHIIEYTNLLTKAVDTTKMNYSGLKIGVSSGFEFYQRKIDLMNEVNVYGTSTFSSSGYDVGLDNTQYAIFRLNPNLKNTDGSSQITYWLRDVISSSQFALANAPGFASENHNNNASASHGVRPRFLIG